MALFKFLSRGTSPTEAAAPQDPPAPPPPTRQQERAAQLQSLLDSLPTTPVERMRGTIVFNEVRVGRIEDRIRSSTFGSVGFDEVEVGEDRKHAVDMVLELSEKDRATIIEHTLSDIVLDDKPLFTTNEIDDLYQHDRHELETKLKPTQTIYYLSKNEVDRRDQFRRLRRSVIVVGDLLVPPFSRLFNTPHEAQQFAEKLKTDLLPRVRKLLDQYENHQQSQTIEF